jgi:hypothetical protein
MSMRQAKHRRIEQLVMESFPGFVVLAGFCAGKFEVEVRRMADEPAWASGEMLMFFTVPA